MHLQFLSPDIKSFLDQSNAQIQSLQTKLTSLLSEKGYLGGSEYEQQAQTFLSAARKNLRSLEPIQTLPRDISLARAQVPLLIELLENMPIPDEFPFKCYDYTGQKATGIIMTLNGQLRFHYAPFGEKDYYSFIDPIHNVGLMGSGKEVVVSTTPDGKLEDALIGPDGKVSCLSLPYTPTGPIKPPAK